MTYLREFHIHWPNLLGACLGLALGAALNHYMLNLFGQPLIAEFGWQKSQFALVGTLGLVAIVAVPFAGRFVDRVGPRIAAMVGFTAVPLGFATFSLMSGNIFEFYGIMLFLNIIGILTTTLVFSRVVVERFDVARGLALSAMMSGAPLIGAVAVPIIGEVIDTQGWRVGYLTLAAMSALGGVTSILLIGKDKSLPRRSAKPTGQRGSAIGLARSELLVLLRQPLFLLLVGGMFLVNLPQIIVVSQLKLVLAESGASSSLGTWLVSLYAVSVVVGRFICGFALDRIPPHRVALATLGLPAIGYLVLASPFNASLMLTASVALIGLAQGAEGDVGAYLTSRKFDLKNFGFVYSFLIASIGVAMAVGSMVLSYSLHLTDSFNIFLMLCAVATLLGAACFFFTGRFGDRSLAEPVAE